MSVWWQAGTRSSANPPIGLARTGGVREDDSVDEFFEMMSRGLVQSDSRALVLKTYGHLMPDSEDRTRRAIDDAWTSDGTQTESDHR